MTPQSKTSPPAEISQLDRLEAIRDRLTADMAESKGSGLAALSRELRAVLAEIEKLAGPRKVSRVDDLAAKRAARIATSEGPDSSAVHE